MTLWPSSATLNRQHIFITYAKKYLQNVHCPIILFFMYQNKYKFINEIVCSILILSLNSSPYLIFSLVFYIPGITSNTDASLLSGDITSISKKITMLEMKEINERQRAEHATQMYEKQRQLLHDLEKRNKELEDKFAEVNIFC